MDTVQLLKVLQGDRYTRQYLRGVFPSDRLPPVNRYPQAFIINSDTSDQSGTHWLACYFDQDKRAEFFDSFGQAPAAYGHYFKTFIDDNSVSCTYNTTCLQSMNTTVCGQYCIFYLVHRCRNVPMVDIVAAFTDDSLINDVLVQDFTEEKYEVDVPVVDFDLMTRQISVKRKKD